MQNPRVGLKRNFNRKGGTYNDKQPMEGMGEVALLYKVNCPERLPAGGGLFRKLVAGRQGFTNCFLRTVN